MEHVNMEENSCSSIQASVERLVHSTATISRDDMENLIGALNLAISNRMGDAQSKTDVQDKVCHLSSREMDVLTLIASGYTRREIGSSLNISRNTAASHIASIYRKLGVSSIAEATHSAIRYGVVKLM